MRAKPMTTQQVLDECQVQRNVAINEANKLRAERDAARREVVALRSTLRAVLDILKSGRSTGRTAIKALFAAEDVIEGALATAE